MGFYTMWFIILCFVKTLIEINDNTCIYTPFKMKHNFHNKLGMYKGKKGIIFSIIDIA